MNVYQLRRLVYDCKWGREREKKVVEYNVHADRKGMTSVQLCTV